MADLNFKLLNPRMPAEKFPTKTLELGQLKLLTFGKPMNLKPFIAQES
jgi:hypothetical protein